MKSKFIAASIFAATGLLSVSSFADSGNGEFYPVPKYGQNTSTLSRAEVKADLQQAKRNGYDTNLANKDEAYPPAPVATTGSGKTRAEVKAELMATSPRAPQYEVDHNYPNVQ